MPVSTSSPASQTQSLRAHLVEFLRGGSAHVDPRTALAGLPERYYAAKPAGLPHSPWQLLEHLRFTLHDLLEFCSNPDYAAPTWPDDYWPGGDAPEGKQGWQHSVEAFLGDLAAFEALVIDPETDLETNIAWGDGQTILREVLLAIDHTSYHLGQLVLVRRELGAWQD